MFVYCKFNNGRQSGLDAADQEEAIGFVKGLQTAASCLDTKVWITTSRPNEAGIDNDRWLSPETWLDLHI